MVIHTECGENPAMKNWMTIRQNIAFLFRTIVPLFVMKISFSDNELVLNRMKIASDPHNGDLPLSQATGAGGSIR